jgi:hypothetical protein
MTDQREIIISVEGQTVSRRNEARGELKKFLEQAAVKNGVLDELEMREIKEDATTQDFGATLIVVLGTPAALAIAKGIHDLIAKRGDSVRIRTKCGEVIATGGAANNINIAETVRAITDAKCQ